MLQEKILLKFRGPNSIWRKFYIVDDEPGARENLQRTFSTLGYEVVTATDGDEAINILAGVDLIVTDLIMKRGDGDWLAKQIRKRGLETPIILRTTSSYVDRVGLFTEVYGKDSWDDEDLCGYVRHLLGEARLETRIPSDMRK